MSDQPELLSEQTEPPLARQPAVPGAICFAVGIFLDRFVFEFSWFVWNVGVIAALVGSVWAWQSKYRRWACAALLLCGVCLGAVRHHVFWSVSTPQHLARFVTKDSRLIHLRGRIIDPPIIRAANVKPFQSVYPQEDTTVFTLECSALKDRTKFIPVKGRVHLRVNGPLPDLRVSDEIELTGWVSRPMPPANPADWDFGEALQRDSIHTIVRVTSPDNVRIVASAADQDWRAWVDRCRKHASHALARSLDDETRPVAEALLLGSRSDLPEETRQAFAESGMMHLLALSGLHVGILAALVWGIARILQLSPRQATVLTFLAVLGLVVISGGRPPIVRAAVLLGVAAFGKLANRQSQPANILALAGLIILAWNPSDLFDVGTQLSFLAVMGILIASSALPRSTAVNDLAPDESQMKNPLEPAFRFLGRWGLQGIGLTFGIWMLTAPLVAFHFHLISPIGFLLNLVLIPLVTLLLWLGFVFLAVGSFFPMIADVLGSGFHSGLGLFLQVVEWGAELPGGHWETAGPSANWLIGYYLVFGAIWAFHRRMRRPWFSGTVVVLLWIACGLAVSLVPRAPQHLRCTFLAVGHGSAILVEFPNGKTLLFDAGALDDGGRATRVIRNELWRRGISHLDAVALSHPDLDHVNAVPELLDHVPVGRVFVSRSFFRSSQDVVPFLLDHLKQHRVPVMTIGADDVLSFDDDVKTEVLHPDPLQSYAHSNANSLVLRLTYQERTLLLTGDVEKEGLWDLMRSTAGTTDVLQAPHHGSRTANTPEIAVWAEPRVVVVSGGNYAGRLEELEINYGSNVKVLSTAKHGAVTITITNAGILRLEPLHAEPSD